MTLILPFHEVQFPPDISFGSTGGPTYSTDIVTTTSGYEQRNINWSQSRCEYQAAHGVKTAKQIAELLAFFRARRGKAIGFRYKDWSDFIGINQVISAGDGTTTTFQLIKTYVDCAGYTEVRTIKKPVPHTVLIYVNKAYQNTVSVDYTTGLITFAVAPPLAATITADFEFDVPCRFDTDKMPINLKEWQLYAWDNVPIVEIKL